MKKVLKEIGKWFVTSKLTKERFFIFKNVLKGCLRGFQKRKIRVLERMEAKKSLSLAIVLIESIR